MRKKKSFIKLEKVYLNSPTTPKQLNTKYFKLGMWLDLYENNFSAHLKGK